MQTPNRISRRATFSMLVPLALSGCAGLATQAGGPLGPSGTGQPSIDSLIDNPAVPLDQLTSAAPATQTNDALDAINTAGVFAAGLDLDSSSTPGAQDFNVASLGIRSIFAVMAVDPATLSPYVGPYPAPFDRTTAAALPKPHVDVTNKAGIHRVEAWYADGSYSRQIGESDATVHEDVIAAPWVATDSVPAPMAQEIALPASASISMAPMRWFVYDGGKTALGYRWRVTDDSTGAKRLSSWIRAFQISGFDKDFNITTIDHTDISTDYRTVPSFRGQASQRVPYSRVSDDYNPDSQARQTSTSNFAYDATSGDGVWTTRATITKNAPNFPLSIAATFDVDTQIRTRDISFTNKTGHDVAIVENFRKNHSGSGTIALDGKQIATIGWRADGKGVMKFTGGGQQVFHVR